MGISPAIAQTSTHGGKVRLLAAARARGRQVMPAAVLLVLAIFAVRLVAARSAHAQFTVSTYRSGLPSTVRELTMDPVTRALWYVDLGNNVVMQIAPDLSVSTIGPRPSNGDVHFAGGYIYGVDGNGSLRRLDPATGATTVVTTLSGFGNAGGLTSAGGHLYATSGTGTARALAEYDLITGVQTTLASNFASQVASLEHDPLSGRLYFAFLASGGPLYRYNPANDAVSFVGNAGSSLSVAIDPTGEFAYAKTGSTIRRISTTTGASSTFLSGLSSATDQGMTFGPSSTGRGYSLYFGNNNVIREVKGFDIPELIWSGASGNWTEAAKWTAPINVSSAVFPNNDPVARLNYLDARILSGSVTLDQNVEIETAYVDGGTLLVSGGNQLSAQNSYLGFQSGKSATATVSGEGSHWESAASLRVGYFGEGILNITDGGLVTAAQSELGNQPSSSGTATVSGEGSHWQNTGILRVGYQAPGELNVAAGGLVTNTDGYVGQFQNAIGTVSVTGSDSLWKNTQSLYLGGNSSSAGGTGQVTVANGGTIEVSDTLKLWSGGTLNLQDGGTVVTQDFDFADGTFNFTGGTLNVSGTATGEVVVPDGGLVTGNTTFDSLTIGDGGAVSPGLSPGMMSAAVSQWEGGGKYVWEINALADDGGTAGDATGWDLLNVSSALAITALPGDSFLIELHTLDALNAAGQVANFDEALDYSWLIASAANGAFSDLSGLEVDASSFLNNLGGGSFGLASASGGTELYLTFTPQAITSSAVVPEPSSAVLLATAVVSFLGSGRRKRKSRC